MYMNKLQKKRMDFAEVTIDNKFHKHIIGKSGQNSKKSFISFLQYSKYMYTLRKRFQSLKITYFEIMYYSNQN